MPKVIVITGGTSGVGHATAERFARRGDSVVIAARNEEALPKVATEIGAHCIAADVARWDDVKRVAEPAASARMSPLVGLPIAAQLCISRKLQP